MRAPSQLRTCRMGSMTTRGKQEASPNSCCNSRQVASGQSLSALGQLVDSYLYCNHLPVCKAGGLGVLLLCGLL